MQLSSMFPTLARVGSIAAAILALLTIVWAILLVFPVAPGSDASPYDRVQFIVDHGHWQTVSFVVAAIMAIVYIPLWAALAALIVPFRQTIGLLIAACGVFFSALLFIGYLTQFTTVQNLDQLRRTNAELALAIVEAWEFSGNFWTASYGIVIAAFVLWGLTTIMVFAGLYDHPDQRIRKTAMLYGGAGVLALTGAIGYAIGAGLLEYGLLLSGLLFVPALGYTALLLARLATNSRVDHSSESTTPVTGPAH
jgi:hypothetical protein